MTITPTLSINDLTIHAAATGQAVVKGVSIDVRPREVVALIGASGSGKTTLALSAIGHLRPGLVLTRGSVVLAGTELLGAAPPVLRDLRGRIGAYVAQSAAAAFNPRILLDRQVTESSLVHKSAGIRAALETAYRNYALLGLPQGGDIGQRYPHQVSGGQLQRFMIAMGLQERPGLLICDEPTSALDVTTQVGVLKALKDGIADTGSAALFVSHDIAVVAQIADRIAVLRHGDLVELGETQQVLSDPKAPYTRELLGAIRHLVTGADLPSPSARTTTASDEAVLLSADGISAGFGAADAQGKPSLTVLHDVGLKARRGEIVAVIGESGSGKSTLAAVIAGLIPPYRGSVSLAGHRLAPLIQDRPPADRQHVQIVLQSADTALNQRHTVGQILGRVLKFFKGLDKPARKARIAELLSLVRLPASYADRQPRQLSGGEKQRVNLARALAADPQVLICDEITSALDTVVAAAIIELIMKLRDELGLAIIFISHDLATVASLANEIVVLNKGRIVEHGATAPLLAAPKDPYTRLLIASVPELRVGWLEETIASRATVSAPATGD